MDMFDFTGDEFEDFDDDYDDQSFLGIFGFPQPEEPSADDREIMIRLMTSSAVTSIRTMTLHQIFELSVMGDDYLILHELGTEIETAEMFRKRDEDLYALSLGDIYILYCELSADRLLKNSTQF